MLYCFNCFCFKFFTVSFSFLCHGKLLFVFLSLPSFCLRFFQHSSDCSNEALGEAVFEALKHSREMPLDEFDELFRSGFLERKYAEFESSLMERFNYKNKRQLYKTMKAVYVNGIENRVELVSTHQDSLDGFCGIEELKPIVTSFDVSAEILGEKIREAYQLSTSKYK
ncbi:contact-dependent growth inhibition system immunity protein [Psychrobacter sp. FDAARGOS_221]|uniref:contact-dependent growth inhibition system immunity protein n=1 Tax=Psychrobacter sp. FDAARGOS_221 TaxID=1975705 RepID=UPI001D0CE947|nr:contact-dependent growth inhibition system immunity protein [Psychrobacter sp. FDAARGOS_221]